jgi:hypothetical protein
MAAASEKECQNMATLQLPADTTITNPVHHIVERKMRCASQQNRYSMTDMGHLRHFERPLEMSAFPPIATKNGEP